MNAYIDTELSRRGIDEHNLALVGFSQGTMMALYCALRRPKPCAGIIGFSGALPGPEKLMSDIKSRPPVLLIHGDRDEMIPLQALHSAASGLGAAGVSVRWHISYGAGHGIAPDGLDLAGRFLQDAFAGKLKQESSASPVPVHAT